MTWQEKWEPIMLQGGSSRGVAQPPRGC